MQNPYPKPIQQVPAKKSNKKVIQLEVDYKENMSKMSEMLVKGAQDDQPHIDKEPQQIQYRLQDYNLARDRQRR